MMDCTDLPLADLSALSREEALACIARKSSVLQTTLDEASKELLRLNCLQNRFAVINNLPIELLVEILHWLVPMSGGIATLVQATHLCQHWRAIALAEPKLWNTFPAHNPTAVKELLQRSRAQPLSLIITGNHDPVLRISRLLSPNAGRIRVLRLTHNDYRSLRRVLDALEAPAPGLEELSVSKTHFKAPNDLSQAPMASPRLFGGHMPSLRTFSTSNVCLELQLPSPSRLVHLELHRNAAYRSSLLDLLDNCPLLETLSVSGNMGFVAPPTLSPTRVASLPHLQLLTLGDFGAPERTASLLSHLSLPQTTRMQIATCHRHPGNGANWQGYTMLPPSLSSHLHPFLNIRRLEAYWLLPATFLLRAYHDPDAFVDPPIELRVLTYTEGPMSLLGDWPFDVSQVETFVLVGFKLRLLTDRCGPAIASLPALRTLRVMSISASAVSSLVHVLSGEERAGSEGDEPELQSPATVNPDHDSANPSVHGGKSMKVCEHLDSFELTDVVPPLDPAGSMMQQLNAMIEARAAAGSLKEVELIRVDGPDTEYFARAEEGGSVLRPVSIE